VLKVGYESRIQRVVGRVEHISGRLARRKQEREHGDLLLGRPVGLHAGRLPLGRQAKQRSPWPERAPGPLAA
jgi:hypothetical protein